jgi:hypothetical protein
MPLKPEVRAALLAAAANNAPIVASRLKVLVKLPGRRALALVNASGQITPAGRVFYEARREAPPDKSFDPLQIPTVRRGREYIRTRDGTMVAVRALVAGKWVFTKIGKQWARTTHVRYVIKLPVFADRDGRMRPDEIRYFPVDVEAVIPAGLSDEQRDERLKAYARDYVATLDEGLVAEEYGAKWYLAPDWENRLREDSERVFTREDVVGAEPTVEAVLDRPLRGRPYLFNCRFPIVDAAFDDTGRCVPHQLSSLSRGGQLVWPDIDDALDAVYRDLYSSDPENPISSMASSSTGERLE